MNSSKKQTQAQFNELEVTYTYQPENPNRDVNSCACCGKVGDDNTSLKACSSCNKVLGIKILYCSIECQQKDWIQGHRIRCGTYKKSNKSSPSSTSSTSSKAKLDPTPPSQSSLKTYKRPSKLWTENPPAALIRQLEYLESHQGVDYVIFLDKGENFEIIFDQYERDMLIQFRDFCINGKTAPFFDQYSTSLPLGQNVQISLFVKLLMFSNAVKKRLGGAVTSQMIIKDQLHEEYGYKDPGYELSILDDSFFIPV